MENLDPNTWPVPGDDPSGVFFTSHEVSFELQDQETLSAWISQTVGAEAFSLNRIDVIFCSDEFLLEINKTHLNHDYYTDIITFPIQSNPIQAELYISIDRIKDNAAILNIPFTEELHRVIIHGVLHLCGYDDHEEAEIQLIRSKEETYLNALQQG